MPRIRGDYYSPKAGVTGSNPVGRANLFKWLRGICLLANCRGAHLVPKRCPSFVSLFLFELVYSFAMSGVSAIKTCEWPSPLYPQYRPLERLLSGYDGVPLLTLSSPS